MTDRLTLTRALESGGMASQAAERIATEIYDAIHDNVATKSDIALVRADIDAWRDAAKTDLRDLEQRLDLRFEQAERRIDQMVMRLGGMIVISTGALIAIKYFA